MEEVCSPPVRVVYSIRKRYVTFSKLKAAIIFHLKKVDQNILKDVISCMPESVFTLIKKTLHILAINLYVRSVFIFLVEAVFSSISIS